MTSKDIFAENFLWGVATAAYQVEGATRHDGRGESIWDVFCRMPDKITHGHTGEIACDQYHRYKEDIDLMHELNVGAYRFSISWPRIFPQRKGKRNAKGFDYYHHLIDALLEAGIKPAITLYHWDLPQALQEEGGWSDRDTAYFFRDYAQACYKELGDKVDFWMTINEPPCIVWAGYETGFTAPCVSDGKAAFRAGHHVNLAHGLAVEAFRGSGRQGQIGIVMNAPAVRPATLREQDVCAADRARDKEGRFFLDPIYGRGYPNRLLAAYPDRPIPLKDGDLEIIPQPTDFLGINNYSELVVAYDPDHPEKFKRVPTCYPKTDMDGGIVPEGMYRLLKWVDEEYDHTPIYVTENGCALKDTLAEDGRCHDTGRIEYLRAYIAACGKALEEGVDLRGYFQWSYIDNFEWMYGYTKRFGIVYCDYVNQRRVPKDSFYFYRDVISGYVRM